MVYFSKEIQNNQKLRLTYVCTYYKMCYEIDIYFFKPHLIKKKRWGIECFHMPHFSLPGCFILVVNTLVTHTWNFIFPFQIYLIYLKITDLQRHRKGKVFHPLACSPDGTNGQIRVRQKPGATPCSSTPCSYEACSTSFPSTLARYLIRSCCIWTTDFHIGCQYYRWQLSWTLRPARCYLLFVCIHW